MYSDVLMSFMSSLRIIIAVDQQRMQEMNKTTHRININNDINETCLIIVFLLPHLLTTDVAVSGIFPNDKCILCGRVGLGVVCGRPLKFPRICIHSFSITDYSHQSQV